MICDPEDYAVVQAELERDGATSGATRRRLAAKVFARNEIRPLQSRIKDELNAWAGAPVCDFQPYSLEDEEQGSSTRLPVGFPQAQRK